jgi:nucleotidyltransferase/DNA polymerase involved in DNA repair
MENPAGESNGEVLRLDFDRRTLTLKVKFADFQQITRSKSVDEAIDSLTDLESARHKDTKDQANGAGSNLR